MKKALALLGSGCIALVGVSAATTPSAKSSKTKTFKFVFRFSDAARAVSTSAPAGSTTGRHARPSPGPVLNDKQTSRVGFGQGHCVITLPNRPLAQCTSSFFFDHGQIATQGPNYFNRPFNHAIIGGTGVFRNAARRDAGRAAARNAGWKITLKVIRP